MGGRKPSIRLYVEVLRPAERKVYEATEVNTLDAEIRLAKTQLHLYLRENGLKLKGGDVVSESSSETGGSRTVLLHTQVVLMHLDKIAKLERARAEMRSLAPADQGEPEGYDAWIAARSGKPPEESSSSGSSSEPAS